MTLAASFFPRDVLERADVGSDISHPSSRLGDREEELSPRCMTSTTDHRHAGSRSPDLAWSPGDRVQSHGPLRCVVLIIVRLSEFSRSKAADGHAVLVDLHRDRAGSDHHGSHVRVDQLSIGKLPVRIDRRPQDADHSLLQVRCRDPDHRSRGVLPVLQQGLGDVVAVAQPAFVGVARCVRQDTCGATGGARL